MADMAIQNGHAVWFVRIFALRPCLAPRRRYGTRLALIPHGQLVQLSLGPALARNIAIRRIVCTDLSWSLLTARHLANMRCHWLQASPAARELGSRSLTSMSQWPRSTAREL